MQQQSWLKDLFNKIDAKDTVGFLSFLTSDARFRFGNTPVLQGREAIGEAVEAFFDSISRSRHRLLHTWSVADAIICQGEVSYTRKDDSKLTLPFVNIFQMQDGLIERYLIYIDITPLYTSTVG
jgi:ketosteroid isomerase-like protein